MQCRARSGLAACLALGGVLPAQFSGTYVLDPVSGTFHTFTEAVNAMFVGGITGDVLVMVQPGTYTESVMVPPIAGTDSFHITFRATVRGTVLLSGSGGDTFALLGVAFRRNRNLVFDGIDFVAAPGHAISGTTFCEGMEIVNCTFSGNHRSTAPNEFRHALIVSENSSVEAGWHVHHNDFTVPSHTTRTSYGIYLSNGGDWNIHDNVWHLNSCDNCLYLINNNRRLDRIWNNQFVGALNNITSTSANSVCVIRADVSNYENDIAHNTFAVTILGSGCCIASSGLSGTSPALNRMRGNVFVLAAFGTCIVLTANSGTPSPFQADGNIYWCPAGEIGRVGPTGTPLTTLASWQAATGQDLLSLESDPMLVSTFSPPIDLHPLTGSPVEGLAQGTPAYVTTDFDGRLRDAAPDAGAFESTSFARYGAGCPGTGGLIPALSNGGTVAIGSTNFSIDLANAPVGALAVLFGGVSRTQASAGPLPLPLGGGCFVRASPDATRAGVVGPVGTLSFLLGIPNAPFFRGINLYFQWIAVDPGSGSPFGLTTSDAGALQL